MGREIDMSHRIFLHGLGQGPSSWDKILSCLPEEKNVFCPDLFRFFGGEECTYQNLFGSFSRYCEKVKEPFHLCGLSLGAVLALHYGICHPQKVRSMVLIAPQYQMPKRLLKIQNGIFHLLPKAAFDGMGLEKKQMICLTNSMQNLQLEEQCRRVSCPVLVLCGKKDRANQKSSVALSELLPQARMEWLKNAGHEANLDAPEELAAAIELFWRDETSRS